MHPATPAVDAARELRTLAELPSPWALPLLGHLPRLTLARLHHQFEGWAEQHGPMYRLRLGFGDTLVLSDPALVGEVLRQRPATWRRLGTFAPVFREIGAHGLFTAEGEDWQRQRRLTMHAFNPAHLAQYRPQLERVAARLQRRWAEAAACGEAIDLQASLMRFTVDAIAGLAFGTDVNTIERGDEDAIQHHLDKVFPMIHRRTNLPWPYWRHVKLPADRRFDAHLAAVHEAIRGFIADARARLAAEPSRAERPHNLLEALLAAGQHEGERFSDTEIAGNVFTMLLGGEDTTANTLAWAIHLLHRHPRAWRTLVEAVDAGDADAWLDAVIQETLRLKPVAPLLGLQSNTHAVVGDVLVPARTPLMCLMRPGAVDAARVPDAAQFQPERWLDDAGLRSGLKQLSMPFGAGPRLCPGRMLAMVEMKLVLVLLARHFELAEVHTADGRAEPEERLAFTMQPQDLRMHLRPRRARSVTHRLDLEAA